GPALTGSGEFRPPGQLEPLTLLTALSQHTSRIGLIATVSSTYNEPYNLARRFASVDHVSGGRAGWNIVTSATPEEAANFGIDDRLDHSSRYARGRVLGCRKSVVGQLGHGGCPRRQIIGPVRRPVAPACHRPQRGPLQGRGPDER